MAQTWLSWWYIHSLMLFLPTLVLAAVQPSLQVSTVALTHVMRALTEFLIYLAAYVQDVCM